MYFQGQPPKSVNMHWRRFKISEIPYTDPAKFELWLRERWQEKDDLIDYYLDNGCFPEDGEGEEKATLERNAAAESSGSQGPTLTKRVGKRQRTMNVVGGASEDGATWHGPIETEVALKYWWEPLEIYTIVGAFGLIARIIFGWYIKIRSFLPGSK